MYLEDCETIRRVKPLTSELSEENDWNTECDQKGDYEIPQIFAFDNIFRHRIQR